MRRPGLIAAAGVLALAAVIVAVVLVTRDEGDDGGATPSATTAAVAAPTAADALPQPVSLVVGRRIYVLRAGEGARPLRGGRGLTPRTWSSDGSLLLAEGGGGALTVLSIGSGTPPQPLEPELTGAAWSPDGALIAGRRGADLVIAGLAGPEVRVGTAGPGGGAAAAWAPDGARLAFALGPADGGPAIAIAPAKGRSAVVRLPLPAAAVPSRLAWSPSGDAIAFDRGGTVNVISTADGELRGLAEGTAPVWSPDGESLAYVAPGGGRIGVIGRDGGDPVLIGGCACTLPGSAPTVAWSAHGDRLVLTSGAGDTLTTVRPDGTSAVAVVRIPGRPATDVLWIPRPG